MSMDKRSIYDGLNDFESDLQNLLTNLAEMKDSLQEVVEKNATLELENQRLREHIRELNQANEQPSGKAKQENSSALSKSRMNLEKFTKKVSTFVMIYMDQDANTMNRVRFV